MDTPSSSSDRDPLERLAAEFLERRRIGENPSPCEYAERFPELAAQILEFFPALEVMEGLKPGISDRTASHDCGARATASPPLEQLGDYRILREIGHGGMGVVYEAIQESLGRRVALKILPLHGRIDPVQMERFQLESRSAARLHHSGIVPVYGVGEHDGVHYYVMQYIQGHGLDVILDDLRRLRAGAAALPASADGAAKDDTGSLAVARSLLTGQFAGSRPERDCESVATVASANGQVADAAAMPEPGARSRTDGKGIGSVLSHQTESGYYRAVARLGVQVAQALAHAHGQGVLHRDIKPSNLLLDVDGHVWITDFGLAKVEGSDGPTRTRDVIGTLRYMGPERFEGLSDRRSDLYGLGMTLYELLTLGPAFEAATHVRLIEQVKNEPPPPPRKVDPRIPRDLETIVLKAIAKQPAERYATAEALAADLENYLADRPIVARRSSTAERAWRWCRRNKAAAGFLAASAVASLTLVGFAVSLAFQGKLRAAQVIAEDALARERDFLYQNRVIFAERELHDNNPHRADELLEQCPPARRGWEWNYLKRQCHRELTSIRAHNSRIWTIPISLDGRLIASAAESDSSVRVWDVVTKQEVQTLTCNGEYVRCALSPDGLSIATVGGSLRQPEPLIVREVRTGRELWRSSDRAGYVSSVAFSRDGGKVIVACGEIKPPCWLKVYDVSTGRELKTIPTGEEYAYEASFDSSGRNVIAVVGSSNGDDVAGKLNEVRVWDLQTGKLRFAPLRGHTKSVITTSFSPDGRMIAASGYDGTVRIYSAADRSERLPLRGHRSCVNQVAFSPDGKRIATSSDDGCAIIWDTKGGQKLFTLRGHVGGFSAVTFNPDGRRLFTSGYEGSMKIWDVTSNPEALSLNASSTRVSSVEFSPDSRQLLTAGLDKVLKLWDVPSGRIRATWTGHSEAVWDVAFSPDGRWVASAAGDWQKPNQLGEVHIWDAATGRLAHPLRAHKSVARSVAFSPDSKRLVSGGGEYRTPGQEVIVWDVESGTKSRSISDIAAGVGSVAFSPDGQRIAAGVALAVQVWDPGTNTPIFKLEGHTARVTDVVFSPDRLDLATSANDGTVRIWDTKSGRRRRSYVADKVFTKDITFSPDAARIVSIGTDGDVKVADRATGQVLIVLRAHLDVGSSVAFSPDGRWIASSDDSGVVNLWDGSPWEEVER
jgi:WD40 repeat protein/serine/threonine protein kinase